MALAVLMHDDRWKGLGPTVKRAVEAAFSSFNSPLKEGVENVDVTVVLSNDAEIKTLNSVYRGKNKPTNVLSFPNGAIEDGVKQLGDIILAYETIAGEAVEQKKKLKDHVAHLTIHGVLHLLGFDHEIEKEAVIMERHEISILKRMGIANPYESA
jgi:probable rRNA maturation factor